MTTAGWAIKKVCLTLLLGAYGAGVVRAQETPSQIFFLHLKLQSNQVSLVSASVSSGRLKVFSQNHAALDVEVATSAGQVLWTNRVADPSIRHLEYEDPDHPGQIISKEVQQTNAEFTIRVPVVPNAHHVNFHLLQL